MSDKRFMIMEVHAQPPHISDVDQANDLWDMSSGRIRIKYATGGASSINECALQTHQVPRDLMEELTSVCSKIVERNLKVIEGSTIEVQNWNDLGIHGS